MRSYRIYAGLGGYFGGAMEQGIYLCENEEKALSIARDLAIEEYISYEDCPDLPSYETMKEDCIDLGIDDPYIIKQFYDDHVNQWIEYWVEEI